MSSGFNARVLVTTALLAVSLGGIWTVAAGCDEKDPFDPRALAFRLGFADSSAAYPYNGAPDADTLADLEAAAGGEIGRLTVRWELVQPAKPEPGETPSYDWGAVEPLIAALAGRGIEPLPVLLGAPEWARDPASGCLGGPKLGVDRICPPGREHFNEFAVFAAALVERFGDRGLAGIEIWNEPNLVSFWAGSAGPDPQGYARLFAAARGAVGAVDPELPVLVGGLAKPTAGNAQRDLPISDFMEGFYASVPPEALDPSVAISFHPYPGLLGGGGVRLASILDEVVAVVERHDRGRALWATEVGLSTTDQRGERPPTMGAQARVIRAALSRLAKEPAVETVLLYTVVDRPNDPADPGQSGYGLVRRGPNFEPKLAYCAIADLRGMPVPDGC